MFVISYVMRCCVFLLFCFSSRRRHTRCALVTGVQTCALPISVRWKIRDPEQFLFALAEPEDTIREVAESSMRAAIGSVTLNAAIGPQRAQIADLVREIGRASWRERVCQ